MKRSTSKQAKPTSHSQRPAASSDKKVKKASHTQGDVPENIDDMLFEITLKKPQRAYNFFIREMMAKDKDLSLIETTKKYSTKWSNVSAADMKRYNEMEQNDKERYNTHLELVRRHILQKPLKEGATAYKIFQDEYVRKAIEKNEEPKEAKKAAAEAWRNMDLEARREYNEKKKKHLEFYENLKKTSYVETAYRLFCRDQMAAAREDNKTMSLKECAEAWNKTKNSIKEKYHQLAEDENVEREKNRDLFDIAFGVKPRRPHGAYKFFLMEMAKEGKLSGKNPLAEGIKLWRKTTEQEKERYQKIAQRDRLAYMVKKMDYDQMQRKNSVQKRALTPLNLFMQDMKGKVDSKDLGKGGFFDHCYKRWSKMEDAAKKKFYKMAEEHKAQLEESRVEESRVFDAPKRPGSAFNLYIADATKALKEKHPKKEQSEIFAMAATDWKKVSDKEKSKYSKQAEKMMEEYKQQMANFNESGFYTTGSAKSAKKKRSTSKKTRSASNESRGKRGKKTSKE